jgi:hypothetical protein
MRRNVFQANHGSDREKVLAAAAAIVHARKAVAKTYRRHLGTRLINWWFRTLTKLGLGASYRHILTVPGRKTGQLHSTPVDVMADLDEEDPGGISTIFIDVSAGDWQAGERSIPSPGPRSRPSSLAGP